MLAQPEPLPETLLSGDPGFIIDATRQNGRQPRSVASLALADYRQAFRDPVVRHGICEDYRAAAGIDEIDDLNDRAAGRRITAPVLVLWEQGRTYGGNRQPLAIWNDWANDVTGQGLSGGHLLPELARKHC